MTKGLDNMRLKATAALAVLAALLAVAALPTTSAQACGYSFTNPALSCQGLPPCEYILWWKPKPTYMTNISQVGTKEMDTAFWTEAPFNYPIKLSERHPTEENEGEELTTDISVWNVATGITTRIVHHPNVAGQPSYVKGGGNYYDQFYPLPPGIYDAMIYQVRKIGDSVQVGGRNVPATTECVEDTQFLTTFNGKATEVVK